MKVPNKISTLTELVRFVQKNNPKILELSKKSKLLFIKEFTETNYRSSWTSFRGIKIIYKK